MTHDSFLKHAIRVVPTWFVACVEARARQNGLFLEALELGADPLVMTAMARARAAKLQADQLEHDARKAFAVAIADMRLDAGCQ